MNCDKCLNSRPVYSENGMHYVCTLSNRSAVTCMKNGSKFKQKPKL